MRALPALFTVSALSAISLPLTFASPTPPSLSLHSDSNPDIPTALTERLGPFHPRGNPLPIYVPAINSQTYVILRAVTPIAGTVIRVVLAKVLAVFVQHVESRSDGPIAGGGFQTGADIFVRARNANNHQITYSVLCQALEAMGDWMAEHGDALVVFEIWDGDNMVGNGVVGKRG